MPPILLDANVLLSAIIATSGPIREIMNAWAGRRFEVVVSQHLLDEVERNLNRPYFADRIDAVDRQAYLNGLRTQCRLVGLPPASLRVATHPEDDLIFATAVAGAVDYLVTGDRQLLALGSHQGVAIVSPADFALILGLQT